MLNTFARLLYTIGQFALKKSLKVLKSVGFPHPQARPVFRNSPLLKIASQATVSSSPRPYRLPWKMPHLFHWKGIKTARSNCTLQCNLPTSDHSNDLHQLSPAEALLLRGPVCTSLGREVKQTGWSGIGRPNRVEAFTSAALVVDTVETTTSAPTTT